MIEYVHATPGIVDGAVHGPDRKRIGYVAGVAEDAWLKPGMWRAYVYPDQGRSYTLHLGVPEDGETTIADAVGEIVPDGIITKGEKGDPGASVTGGRDNGDGAVSFELSDGTFTDPVVLPPGPAGRGIASISDPDQDSRVTITYTDGSTATVQAIRGAQGEPGEKGDPGADSTVPGPPGPPGQVLTPESMLVVGPGRPDAPTTTGMTSEALAALPVGCEYRSTDGAGTGAWVWQKRPAGWVVTDGDTGWREVPTLLPQIPILRLRRVGWDVLVEWPRSSTSQELTDRAQLIKFPPTGFTLAHQTPVLLQSAVDGGSVAALISDKSTGGWDIRITGASAPSWLAANTRFGTADAWPTTLPGDAA